MKKFACTLSLFLGALGLLYVGFTVRVPDYFMRYVCRPCAQDAMMPAILWLCYLGMAIGAILMLTVIWFGCAKLCAKLRGEA